MEPCWPGVFDIKPGAFQALFIRLTEDEADGSVQLTPSSR